MENKDPKIREAIVFFEAILESMPGDRTSLEFLVVAYDQVGAMDKRRRCLIDLATVLLAERDFEKAQAIAAHLKAFPHDREAQSVAARVEQVLLAEGSVAQGVQSHRYEDAPLQTESDGSLNIPDPVIEVYALSRAALAAEMDLVWMLRERELVPKGVCDDLIRELGEFPVADTPQLISAMVLLDERHPELTESVMCELQMLSKMPAIPLELFDFQGLKLSGITSAYIKVRGAIPFAMMADEFLVGVMNPLDIALQEDISARLGTACHFFLAHPRACQQTLESKFAV